MKLTKRADYSFAWAGHYKGDDNIKNLMTMTTARTVKEVMEKLDENGKDGYRGLTMNMMFADYEGNIGYMQLFSFPNRKSKTPFIGCRVLDGTTSANDWDGLLPLSASPRSFNPAKGFLMTANNRQSPDHALYDSGAT